MSIETISNAVCASSELCSTACEIMFGLASTSLWSLGRADGLDDALADAGDDRLLGRPADQPLELGPHRHAGLGPELNAVAADGVEGLPALGRVGAVDDLRIDAGLDGVEDVAAGQVDGGGRLPRQVDAGLVGGDDRRGRLRHVAAGQVVRLQVLGRRP